MAAIEREEHEAKFNKRAGELVAAIERTAPNLKAVDQYDALQRREKEVTEKFEAARKQELDVSEKYKSIRQRRYQLFMEAFGHISKAVDETYKQLTSGNHTSLIGGTAYLNLENPDEPFLHGIKYSVVPPNKGFIREDMDILSGGEKTIAALALLFAIHNFRPSPFFILDEVDAALDNLNVARVTGFIRSKSCQRVVDEQAVSDGRCGFQSTVMSLKASFFEQAEAQVGVCKDLERSCSTTITFDLTKQA